MKHPDTKKLREVIEAMKTVAERPELHEIDITSTEEPSCGTPGCHAGLAKAALDCLGYPPSDDGHYDDDEYHYENEADRLARYLGYDQGSDLEDWAYSNPELWGNDKGDLMFYSRNAFDEPNNIFPSEVVIKWWENVLGRLLAMEKAGGRG